MQITHRATLRALTEQRGLSYAGLARLAGCSKPFIGHLASGHKTGARPELAERIAEALAVPVDVLFVPEQSIDSGHSDHSEQIKNETHLTGSQS